MMKSFLRQIVPSLGISIFFASMTAPAAPASGPTSVAKSERSSLARLGAISVVVEDIETELESHGISKTQMKTDVELRLRKSGIRISDEAAGPYLYINVAGIKVSEYTWAFSVRADLYQEVLLPRNKAMYLEASTWHKGGVAFYGIDRLSGLREFIRDFIDQFANDYLAANER